MVPNILEAKNKLLQGGYTCVALNDDGIYTSMDRGVKPLLDWISNKCDLKDAYVADKVVGKAAAFLYVLLKVKEVYAVVISEPALITLEKHNIKVSYGQLVSAIRNRDNTGFCPMESSVWDIEDPNIAYETIVRTRNELILKNN